MVQPLLPGPFTVETYQRLAELGVLREDDRVELIAGQVVEMSPIGPPHASCVRRLIRILSQRASQVAIVDVQNPLVLGERDAPQPDVVLLKLPDPYPNHPQAHDTLLVIEVADSTVVYDREIKVPLYARTGVPEVWLVNLPANRIETYRDLVAGEYTGVCSVGRGEVLIPVRVPAASIAVDEILG